MGFVIYPVKVECCEFPRPVSHSYTPQLLCSTGPSLLKLGVAFFHCGYSDFCDCDFVLANCMPFVSSYAHTTQRTLSARLSVRRVKFRNLANEKLLLFSINVQCANSPVIAAAVSLQGVIVPDHGLHYRLILKTYTRFAWYGNFLALGDCCPDTSESDCILQIVTRNWNWMKKSI